MRVLSLLLAGLLTSCTAAEAYTGSSGSRIKVKAFSTADGARGIAGWYDSMLKIDCAFGVAPDGKLRCLPTSVATVASYYADSGCSTALAVSGCGQAPPPYGWIPGSGASCSSGQYVQLTPHQGVLYVGSPTNCAPTDPISTLQFFRTVAVVAPSIFAEGTVDVQ